jgi:hypothetical protein
MLYREIIVVCSEIHTKHINTLCGQKVELLNIKLVVHVVTTGLYRPNYNSTKPITVIMKESVRSSTADLFCIPHAYCVCRQQSVPTVADCANMLFVTHQNLRNAIQTILTKNKSKFFSI